MAVSIVLAAGIFLVYEELRRARRKDFPFQWDALFLHGLLVLAIGILVALFIRMAISGGPAWVAWASVVLAVPSVLLAVAPYVTEVFGVPWFPERLVGEGFHQLGMAGLGLAIGLPLAGRLSRGSPVRRQAIADDLSLAEHSR
ncbi:MAG: hypothetical protein ACRDXD_00515 [Acidimicrobiia bacterium]